MTCQRSNPVEVTKVGMAISPRTVHSMAMVIKAVFIKGVLRIKPTAEHAKIVHANIKLATINVPIGARRVPCCDESIIN